MSDYIERLMGRARDGDFWNDGLPARNARSMPKETRAVRRDGFDKAAWSEITDQVRALGEQVARAEEEHGTAAGAYEDLFNMLNQGDPRFHEAAAMQADYVPQLAMEEQMFASQDFQWVRNETKYDSYNTALAMLSMERQMDSALGDVEDIQEQIREAQEELEQAMEAARIFIQKGEGPAPEPGNCPGPPLQDGDTVTVYDTDEPGKPGQPLIVMNPDTEQSVIDRLENALKGMAEAQDQGADVAEEAGKQMEAAASKARDAIEGEQQQAAGYGIEPGTLKRMGYEERRALAERLNKNRLARFAKLLGGLRMAADADRRKKITGAPAEIYDLEIGRDLTKITASEMNDLANPDTEDMFWLRYAQSAMLQWKVRGPEQAGQGPIIVVCDESWSMSTGLDSEGNTREAWSKAVSLALCDQAKRGNRDFIYVGFSSSGQVWETRFVNGRYDSNQIIDFAEHFFAGGTAYEQPLVRAMEIIGEYERARKAKPDVVFITDAECHVADDFIAKFREVRERADVRCYGIQIGGSGYYTAMESLVDRLINISAFNANYQAVAELFRTI